MSIINTMYNINFKVKYFDIKEELLLNFNKSKGPDSYSIEDINDICSKLYFDEFISVFGVDNILDSKIDKTIHFIFNEMCNIPQFINIIKQIQDSTHLNSLESSIDKQKVIVSILFSESMFHLTHKCICELYEKNMISNVMLEQIRNNLYKMININMK